MDALQPQGCDDRAGQSDRQRQQGHRRSAAAARGQPVQHQHHLRRADHRCKQPLLLQQVRDGEGREQDRREQAQPGDDTVTVGFQDVRIQSQPVRKLSTEKHLPTPHLLHVFVMQRA